MANKNENLSAAKNAKKDEFYTQLVDIENELRHYKEHFKDKIVFCNCDDPYESNFVKYFAMNFNALGLKKLIATCYTTSPVMYTQLTFFGEEEVISVAYSGKKPYVIEISEVTDENGDGAVDLTDFELILKKNKPKILKGDGDFRSAECIEYLKEADIVVTNPPFSLFREYVAQLMEYDKKFIIIGNQNAITYKEVFPLIKENRLWLGFKCGDMAFTVPESYEARETRFWVDESGQKWRSFGNICWYTNLDHSKRHDDVTSKKGIYEYLLSGKEKVLSIRAFTNSQKATAYAKQNGICPICQKHFELDRMHADHITPWHAGGKTVPENLQMLCRDCNLKKSGQE